jgi:uncharacterized protein YukE
MPANDIETGGGGSTGATVAPLEIALPPDPETGKLLKPLPETTLMERIAGGVALVAVVTALAAMIIEQSVVVIVGGILSAIVGPYAYYQQVQLTDIKALQETHAVIKVEVDKLSTENKRLAKNIDEMSGTVQNLKDVEDALDVITKVQGQSVEEFKKQVQTSKEILAGMQSNLKTNILQNLLTLVLGSDANRDNSISEEEVNALIRRIVQMPGVTVKEDLFKKMVVGKDPSAIMEIIRNLLREDVPEEENIFTLSQ